MFEIYGKEAYEFNDNVIIVTLPFNRLTETPQVTPQVSTTIGGQYGLDEVDGKIIAFCSIARSRSEIMENLNYKDRKAFRKRLNALISSGRIAMTEPDKPNSSKQKYIAINK